MLEDLTSSKSEACQCAQPRRASSSFFLLSLRCGQSTYIMSYLHSGSIKTVCKRTCWPSCSIACKVEADTQRPQQTQCHR